MQIKQYQTTKYIMGNGALREVQRWKDKKIGLVVDENVLKALQLETKLFDELLKDCDYEVLCNMPQEPTTELLEPEIAAKQTVRIRNAIRKLEQLPARHASVNWEPWFSMGMRKLIVDHYTVFYLVHEPACEVRIVRIVYSGRDLKSILNDSVGL